MANEATIFELDGLQFFEKLESELQIFVPPAIKNILMICGCDNVQVLNDLDNSRIEEMQDYVRNVFDEGETMKEILGRYAACKQRFQFNLGQTHFLHSIAEKCRSLKERRFNSVRMIQGIIIKVRHCLLCFVFILYSITF